jgi:hypothetical protein
MLTSYFMFFLFAGHTRISTYNALFYSVWRWCIPVYCRYVWCTVVVDLTHHMWSVILVIYAISDVVVKDKTTGTAIGTGHPGRSEFDAICFWWQEQSKLGAISKFMWCQKKGTKAKKGGHSNFFFHAMQGHEIYRRGPYRRLLAKITSWWVGRRLCIKWNGTVKWDPHHMVLQETSSTD